MSQVNCESSHRAAARHLCTVDGWPITVATQREAVDAILRAANGNSPFTVFTLNLDHLVKLRTDAAFRQAYARASLVSADGAPVVWLARRQGATLERTTGADLVVPLARAAASAGLPMFLFGTTDDVLGIAGRRLSAICDGDLDICGSLSPSASFDPHGPEADAALETVRRSGARICLLALGAPKQEVLAARAAALGIPVVFVCVGAALDFIAGRQTRAPEWMQRHGLEWLWRLSTNPARLAARYARCAVVLADIAIVKPARDRLGGAVSA